MLIVSAATALAGAVQMALQHSGMATEMAATEEDALASQAADPAGVVIVDLDLPDTDPMALVTALAAGGASGVIALARNAQEASWLRAAEGGPDDVATRPLALRTLVARVRALERRRREPASSPPPSITVDRTEQVLADPSGRRTRLSDAEFAALTTLLDAEGASVSRAWLGRAALRRTLYQDDTAIDALMDELRRKLAVHGAPARTIQSARGQGYVIADPAVFAETTEVD